jgi:hypothetical protein
MNHKNLSVTSVFSVVKKQKNFGITPKSEAKHWKNGPKAARKLQPNIKVKEY